MTTKKKKKTAMNAVDKYLMQKRYSQGKKDEKNEKPSKKNIQIVVSKVDYSSKLNSSTVHTERRSQRSARSAKIKLPEKKKLKKLENLKVEKNDAKKKHNNLRKSIKGKLSKLPKDVLSKKQKTTGKTTEIQVVDQTKSKRNPQINQKQLQKNKDKNTDRIELSKNKPKSGTRRKRVENLEKTKETIRAVKTRLNKKSNDNFSENLSGAIQKKLKKSKRSNRTAKTISNKKSNKVDSVDNLSKNVDTYKTTKNSTVLQTRIYNEQQEHEVTNELSSIIETSLIAESNIEKVVLDFKKRPVDDTSQSLPKKKIKMISAETETAKTDPPDLANEPCCSYDDISSNRKDENDDADTEVIEEITPITKKYQPYMERLKSLTSDAINKFIKDNQQYYVDYKKEIESKSKSIPIIGKKTKKYDEMRDNFKCNPFSSDQQLAMYYTLREIFDVPNKQFLECRNFLTILLPEISCQLFAETFRIKVSFAPRLIKKLYPNPVCPV